MVVPNNEHNANKDLALSNTSSNKSANSSTVRRKKEQITTTGDNLSNGHS